MLGELFRSLGEAFFPNTGPRNLTRFVSNHESPTGPPPIQVDPPTPNDLIRITEAVEKIAENMNTTDGKR